MGHNSCFVLFSRFPPSWFTWLEGKLKSVSILDSFTLPFRCILNRDNFKLQRTLKMVNTTGVRRGTRYMFSRDFRKRGKFFVFQLKFVTRLLYFDITLIYRFEVLTLNVYKVFKFSLTRACCVVLGCAIIMTKVFTHRAAHSQQRV